MSDEQDPIDDLEDLEELDEFDENADIEYLAEFDEIAPIDPTNMDMIETARRKYGTGGAAIAAGMFGLDIALGNKKKPESVQIQEAPSQPVDVDTDGIEIPVDMTTTVTAPALARRSPIGVGKKKSRRK